MISNARGIHQTPGVYMKETDIPYATKSLGITQLGVVGETLKGPAFEPVSISDWTEFQEYFGGTSTEKFIDSNYPKYELPYIAQSYLEESKKLTVCRILGLSGYNAGPAYIIHSNNVDGSKKVVALLRSRGSYTRHTGVYDPCKANDGYDKLSYFMDPDYTVSLEKYKTASYIVNNCGDSSSSAGEQSINEYNFGRFNLTIKDKEQNTVAIYPVSFNPGEKDYIINVLGMTQDGGNSLLYVEELYDVALAQDVKAGKVTGYGVEKVPDKIVNSSLSPVSALVYIEPTELRKNMQGRRFLATKKNEDFAILGYRYYTFNGIPTEEATPMSKEDFPGTVTSSSSKYVKVKKDEVMTENPEDYNYFILGEGVSETDKMTAGHIYTIVQKTGYDGKSFVAYEDTKETIVSTEKESNPEGYSEYVYVNEYDRYFTYDADKTDVVPSTGNLSNYKEQYRSAMTPWIVSELKGSGNNVEVKRLFRFHTISDGNASNSQVKISIANIDPDRGTFDVLIRDFNDVDGNANVLERYNRCTMEPGTTGFIGLKIGTFDGEYELKSKYVSVEVIANDSTVSCVPGGFMGYPLRVYPNDIKAPTLKYNTTYNDEIKETRQYFGMSNITGVDVDVLNYKGVDAYDEINDAAHGYTNGFHLDSYISISTESTDSSSRPNLYVDGESGYEFTCVDADNGSRGMFAPRLGSDMEMANTIYESKAMRKFTVYPYGGFDGWDVYRGSRTNTDDFKYGRYQDDLTKNFALLSNGEALDLPSRSFSSDYYAYLAGYRQFANRQKTVINLLATPGIDYVNNESLVKAVQLIVEDERQGDTLYVVTTPDKPFGATDFETDMYTSEDAVLNYEDSEIDSSYMTTFYPWVRFYDRHNKRYIMLPPTKDVMRNFAYTDNSKDPWWAAAGTKRGRVECADVHRVLRTDDEDVLYEGRINPIKKFSKEGVLIWGNKTMYPHDTPLNRTHVRRLMIRIKKLCEEASHQLIFDPNDDQMGKTFKSIIDPILSEVKSRRGISDFKTKDESSPETRDRHELPFKVWIKPIGSLEYIDINFIITPEGARFEE